MASDFKVLKKTRVTGRWTIFKIYPNISEYIQTLECDIFMDIGENVLKIF